MLFHFPAPQPRQPLRPGAFALEGGRRPGPGPFPHATPLPAGSQPPPSYRRPPDPAPPLPRPLNTPFPAGLASLDSAQRRVPGLRGPRVALPQQSRARKGARAERARTRTAPGSPQPCEVWLRDSEDRRRAANRRGRPGSQLPAAPRERGSAPRSARRARSQPLGTCVPSFWPRSQSERGNLNDRNERVSKRGKGIPRAPPASRRPSPG